MLAGAWVSANPADTELEIKALISAANTYPDVIDAVIVGDEVLLRKEATESQLVALIARVKAAVQQPGDLCRCLGVWIKHPQMAPAVDFLTIHLLPVLGRRPDRHRCRAEPGRQRAPCLRQRLCTQGHPDRRNRLAQRRPPARDGTAEPGQRGPVHPGLRQAGRGQRLALQPDRSLRPEPWKRADQGAVGGFWGLYDADRGDKGILAGPVSNLPLYWPRCGWVPTACCCSPPAARRRPASSRAALLLPLVAALGAACSLGWSELALVGPAATGASGCGRRPCSASTCWCWRTPSWPCRRARAGRASFAWLEARGGWWLVAAGFAGAVLMLGLVFDSHLTAASPAWPCCCRRWFACGRCVRRAARCRPADRDHRRRHRAGCTRKACRNNLQAIGWALTSALLVAALWRSLRHSRG